MRRYMLPFNRYLSRHIYFFVVIYMPTNSNLLYIIYMHHHIIILCLKCAVDDVFLAKRRLVKYAMCRVCEGGLKALLLLLVVTILIYSGKLLDSCWSTNNHFDFEQRCRQTPNQGGASPYQQVCVLAARKKHLEISI